MFLYKLTQKLKLQTVQRIYPISTHWLVSYHFFIFPRDQTSLATPLGRTSKMLLKSQVTEKLAEFLNPPHCLSKSPVKSFFCLTRMLKTEGQFLSSKGLRKSKASPYPWISYFLDATVMCNALRKEHLRAKLPLLWY